MRVDEQQLVFRQDLPAADAFLAQDAAQLAFQVEHLRGGEHRVRVLQPEEPAAGQHLVPKHVAVAHRHDRLKMGRDGPLRHQLIELNERQRPIARIVLNRLRAAFGALLHDAKHDLAELQQVAVMHRARLLDSRAVDVRAVRAAQVAQQQSVVDDGQLGVLARHRRAGNAQRRVRLAADDEPRRVDAESAHRLVVGQLPAEQPRNTFCLKCVASTSYITNVLHISWRDCV